MIPKKIRMCLSNLTQEALLPPILMEFEMIRVISDKSCELLLNSGLFSEAYRDNGEWVLVLLEEHSFRKVKELICYNNIADYKIGH